MAGCIICEIAANRMPAWVVYRDADVICFLPKTLEAYGHTVIATTAHYADIFSTPESLLGALTNIAKRLAVHYSRQIGSSGVNILHASGSSAQQSVLHMHLHLIPRFDNDGLNAWPSLTPIECDKEQLLKKLALGE